MTGAFSEEFVPKHIRQAVAQLDDAHRKMAENDPNAFMTYVLRHEETDKPILQSAIHQTWQILLNMYKRTMIWAHVEAGKCLGPETLVLMHDGTTKRADAVERRDLLMGPDSQPRTVLSTTRGVGQMFKIVPNKGAPWTCNDVHVLTLVHTVTNEVIDVALNAYLRWSGWQKSNYKLFQPAKVDFARVETLPVDPYFLGLWLGDGTKDLHSVVVTKPDAEVQAACAQTAAAWGLRCSTRVYPGKCPQYAIVSEHSGQSNPLLDALRSLMAEGVRVPHLYRTASRIDRWRFLSGVLDADGYLTKGCYEVVQKNEAIAEGVAFVARSLGLRVTERDKVVNGATYKRLFIQGDFEGLATRIARKTPPRRSPEARDARRTGFSIVPLGEGDYAGFTLDEDGRFLLADYTVTHNTNQISIGRTLYELGKNPNLRIVVVSNTHAQATKITRACAKYIEGSEEYHRVFPHIKRDKKRPWTSNTLFVERETRAKDASLTTCGIHGNILGARIDLLIIDDIIDYENSLSEHQRNDLFNWFQSTLEGRLTMGARVWCVGTAWHRDDLMHRFAKSKAWKSVRFPVVDKQGKPTWPEAWPLERIAAKRAIIGPLEFSRQFLCVARSNEDSRFKEEWIAACMKRGEGMTQIYQLDQVPVGFKTYTGVDLGTGRQGSDLTVLFTIMIHPNGDRQVLECKSGNWNGPEIVRQIIDAHARYKSVVHVEDNGAQKFILDEVKEQSAVPVKPYNTGAKVYVDPALGMESMAIEMFNQKWIIPNTNGVLPAELESWRTEMMYYDPKTHPGDRLMASWFAREGAGRVSPMMDALQRRLAAQDAHMKKKTPEVLPFPMPKPKVELLVPKTPKPDF